MVADAEVDSSEKIQRLTGPILAEKMDLVTPAYAHDKFEGTINSGIVYPLTSALYGKRIHGQLGIDFGFSAGMMQRCLQLAPNAIAPMGASKEWMVVEAICGGLQVGEAEVGRRKAPHDSRDLSTALAQTLGPIFIAMERQAPFWQKILGVAARAPLLGIR